MAITDREEDFGYGAICWEDANAENLAAVEAEFRDRLAEETAAWDGLDDKARFSLTWTAGGSAAISGWAFVNAPNLEFYYLVGIFALAATLSVASIFSALSLMPKRLAFSRGVTPTGLNVALWSKLIMGSDADRLRLSGLKIREYAKSIENNAGTNRLKSKQLKLGLAIATLAFPIAALSTALAFLVNPFIDPAHFPVAPPIFLGILATLVFGSFLLWWRRLWDFAR